MRYSGHIELLASKSQAPYYGVFIPREVAVKYLEELKIYLGSLYYDYIDNQRKRDRGKYHMTLIAPCEQFCRDNSFEDHELEIELLGVGKASNHHDTSFFIVAQCQKGDNIRQKLKLPPRDFHITLGFSKKDVHNVRKDSSSIIIPVNS